jgi:hypothetical protein
MSWRSNIPALLLLSLLVAGCRRAAVDADAPASPTTATDTTASEFTQPVRTEPVSGPTPLRQLRKADFQGWYLTVLIDGREALPSYLEGERQIWTAGVVSTTPSVEFVADRPYLGAFEEARLTLRPIRNGQVVMEEVWLYAGEARCAPLRGVRLDRLRRVDGEDVIDHAALPPGRYRLNLHVRGERTWDRQYVDLTIK